MSKQKQGLFSKVLKAAETALDGYIAKAQGESKDSTSYERKALIDVEYPQEQQYGWKERRGLIGPAVMKNMARKDSIIASILFTRLAQLTAFTKKQEDKYSPGYKIKPRKPADLTREEKLVLSDPEILKDEALTEKVKYDLAQKLAKKQEQQDEEIKQLEKFILNCGVSGDEPNTTNKRVNFGKFVKLIGWDRLVYNYSAIELVPTKDGKRLHHFYPVSAGTIRFVTKESAKAYKTIINDEMKRRNINDYKDDELEFTYAQVVRGRITAAWTEKEMVFEPGNPTIDPEDQGYSPGELEHLIQIITAHLYAEAHNRNFFTQGIGSKGILHIKGENINRAQLESFKRHWFNQMVSTRNTFRPPIIGMADEVKWVELAQSNRDMEFDNWMHYLIRVICAIYQIDPAEINFDISKINTSTLNETSNEMRIKASRDKGLRPLLNYIENIINNELIKFWNPELYEKYEFRFVGLDAETRKEEIDRLEKETRVWKTANEARVEMGYSTIEDGDLILNATFTQYKQMKEQQKKSKEQSVNNQITDQNNIHNSTDIDETDSKINKLISDLENTKIKERAKEEVKKAKSVKVEYYTMEEDKDE